MNRKKIVIYTLFERLWHWVQAACIVTMIATGLVITRPELADYRGYAKIVELHNSVGLILVATALLGLFYHLSNGRIRQFLPEGRNCFSNLFKHLAYYTSGIFRGDKPPFSKTPDRKILPLQKVTYLIILNVLLPAQIITGMTQIYIGINPEFSKKVGGLAAVAPVHALCAWLFICFLIIHVYMTTLGNTPFSGVKAMITGKDVVEEAEEAEE